MYYYLTHRMIKEGDKFVVRVRHDEHRYQNLNLLIKDFIVVTGLCISEDYCLRDNMTMTMILSSELLVKGGIYRLAKADNITPL